MSAILASSATAFHMSSPKAPLNHNVQQSISRTTKTVDSIIDSDTQESVNNIQPAAVKTAAAIFTAAATATKASLSTPAHAVSGGGLDYAGIDITGQDFSNSKAYKGKDFTQTIAKGTNFSGSNLQGCRFYKAFLVNTNFESADIRGASLEDTSMDGANLKNAIAAGTYFGASLVDIADAEGADFTDASIPPKTLARFCDREDIVKGTNPITGNDTRDTLMCP